jgi:hypothetical protein
MKGLKLLHLELHVCAEDRPWENTGNELLQSKVVAQVLRHAVKAYRISRLVPSVIQGRSRQKSDTPFEKTLVLMVHEVEGMGSEKNHKARSDPVRRDVAYIVDCNFVERREALVSATIDWHEHNTAKKSCKS